MPRRRNFCEQRISSARQRRGSVRTPRIGRVWQRILQMSLSVQKDVPQITGSKLLEPSGPQDRKSTRLNSSHLVISYAVFCLKKKNIHALRRTMSRQLLATLS